MSYVSEERALAQHVAHALEVSGFSVWWDRDIRAGADFSAEIQREIAAAKSVVVLWSGASQHSKWVRDEAAYARDENKLIPLRIDATEPPLGFRQVQSLDFADWDGDLSAGPFVKLLSAIRHHAGDIVAAPVDAVPAKARIGGARRLVLGGAAALILLAIGATVWWLRPASTPQLPPIRSLAVLPLDNLSGDPEQEYFADGMTETLTAELSKLPDVRVISRTSVMQFKRTKTSLPEIARILDVEGIIEGSVMRVGDQVRITTQLIDARSDKHLWAAQYDRQLARVLEIQSEVAKAVSNQIELALTPQQAARFTAPKSVDPRAQDVYFRGLALRRFDAASLAGSIAAFEEAVKIAPDFALAHAQLAVTRIFYGLTSDGAQNPEIAPARAAAERAIALDERLGEAHCALAVVSIMEWQWADAEREMLRSFDLGTADPVCRSTYAVLLLNTGRRAEAFERTDAALASAPLDAIVQNQHLLVQLKGGRLERALVEIDEMLATDPANAGLLLASKARALGRLERFEEAIAAWRTLFEMRGDPRGGFADELGQVWKTAGRDGYWHFLRAAAERNRTFFAAAVCSAQIGAVDEGMAALERARAEKDVEMYFLVSDDALRPLHSDPRFIELARIMKLPLSK